MTACPQCHGSGRVIATRYVMNTITEQVSSVASGWKRCPTCLIQSVGALLTPAPLDADAIQHDMEITCPKCLQPYKDHKGDEVEVVCPSPPRPMVTGGALIRFDRRRIEEFFG